jgi:hypothetical protein
MASPLNSLSKIRHLFWFSNVSPFYSYKNGQPFENQTRNQMVDTISGPVFEPWLKNRPSDFKKTLSHLKTWPVNI